MNNKGSNGIDYGTIRELIQKIAGTYGKANVKLFDGTVMSVDNNGRTCTVDSIDSSLNGIQVRFMLEVSDGDMSVPQVGSTVTVAMTDFTDPYIVSATWLDEKLFVVGNQSYDIKPDKQIFNDGSYDGLVKVIDLTTKLNAIENLINNLLEAVTAVVILGTVADGGAVKAGILLGLGSGITPITQQSDIENTSITHGSSF